MGVAERPHDVQGFSEAYVGIAKTTLATSSATRPNLLVYVYQTFKNCLPCKGRLTCLHFCIELTMKIKTFYNLLCMFQFPNSHAMLQTSWFENTVLWKINIYFYVTPSLTYRFTASITTNGHRGGNFNGHHYSSGNSRNNGKDQSRCNLRTQKKRSYGQQATSQIGW